MMFHQGAGWYIRPFRIGDFPACRHIFFECLDEFSWVKSPLPYIKPLVRSLHLHNAWIAEEKQAGIVGFLSMISDDAYVDHLFVARDWRLCGVGRGLLEAARANAGKPLLLTVDANNHKARLAYEAMGWRPTGIGDRSGQRTRIRLLSA